MSAEEKKELTPGQNFELTMVSLYEFNFHRADSISDSMLKTHPDNYLSSFARANYLWWMLKTAAANDSIKNEYDETIEQTLEKLQKSTNKKPEDVFYFLSLRAMQGRAKLEDKQFIPVIVIVNSCIHEVEFSLGREDIYGGFNLTSGLYNYMIGFAREEYPVLRLFTVLFPESGLQQGLCQLNEAADGENQVWRTEANFLLMKIYLEMEKQPEIALSYLERLLEEYPENLLYRYYLWKINKSMKNHNRMVCVMQEIQSLALNHRGIKQHQKEYFLKLTQ